MGATIVGCGKQARASKTRGWVVGHMMPDGHTGQTTGLEIKLWRYDSQPDYPPKRWNGHEFITVYRGVLKIRFSESGSEELTREVTLRTGEYILFPPGVVKRVFAVKTPVWGDTIRWPSGPGVSTIL